MSDEDLNPIEALFHTDVNTQEVSTEVSKAKVVDAMFSQLEGLEHVSIISRSELSTLTDALSFADDFDLPPLIKWIQNYLKLCISVGGEGRKQGVAIAKEATMEYGEGMKGFLDR